MILLHEQGRFAAGFVSALIVGTLLPTSNDGLSSRDHFVQQPPRPRSPLEVHPSSGGPTFCMKTPRVRYSWNRLRWHDTHTPGDEVLCRWARFGGRKAFRPHEHQTTPRLAFTKGRRVDTTLACQNKRVYSDSQQRAQPTTSQRRSCAPPPSGVRSVVLGTFQAVETFKGETRGDATLDTA